LRVISNSLKNRGKHNSLDRIAVGKSMRGTKGGYL